MRDPVWKAVDRKWPESESPKRAKKILELSSYEPGSDVVIVGVILKQMELRPDVLKDLVGLLKPPSNAFTSEEGDSLVIEDENGRAELDASPETVNQLCTGIVCAVRGIVKERRGFRVTEVVFPGPPPMPALSPSSDDQYMLFVSDLKFGDVKVNSLKRQLLLDFINGSIGSNHDIIRVVIAGGSVEQSAVDDVTAITFNPAQARLYAQKAVEPLTEFDMFLAQMLTSVPVTLIPGLNDPTTYALPQAPIHPSLLPLSSRYSTLSLVSNPIVFVCDGVECVGSGGQPITDMHRCTRDVSPLTLLSTTLQANHLCPTGPDTLPSYPYVDTDPFIITSSPHLLFTGCQPCGESMVVDGVSLLCVPSFAQTGTAMLLNTKTMETERVEIGVEMSE